MKTARASEVKADNARRLSPVSALLRRRWADADVDLAR
jgi:hypothetical protein